MALVGGRLAAAILNRYEWHDVEAPPGYEGSGKIEALFGPTVWDQIADKVVLDFGCGPGREAIELARHGAKQVIGLDIQEKHLAMGRAQQAAVGVVNCSFVRQFDSRVDIVLSVDSFEHFGQSDEVLMEMARMLKTGWQGDCVLRSTLVPSQGRAFPFIFLGPPAANREVVDEMAFEVQTGWSEEISRGCRRLKPNEHPQI